MKSQSNKLKVLIISNNYMPYFDGVSIYTKNLQNQLLSCGYEVRLLNFDRESSFKQLGLRDLFYTYATKNSYYSPWSLFNPRTVLNNDKGFRNYVFTNMVYRVSGKIIKEFQPDIIHITHPRVFSAVVNTKTAVVLAAHSEEIKDIYPVKKIIDIASAIVCISKFTTGLVTGIEASSANKLYIISNSIDVAKYSYDSKIDSIKKENYLISVGRLSEEKNFDTTIRAFSLLPESIKKKYKYIIVGDGKERESLQKLIFSLRLENSVKLLGNIHENKKIILLKKSKYFILCPRIKKGEQEGFGIAYLEAQAAGLPIIATNIGGIKEAVGKAGLYVGDSEDPYEIAECLSDLINDDKLNQKLSKAARKRIVRFDHEDWVNKIDEIYKKVINA